MCWQAMGLGRMQSIGRMWEFSLTWSEIMGVGGFDPSATYQGVHAVLVHGIASRPKPKPKTPAAPATGGPPQLHSPNPRHAFAKSMGAICPTLDVQGTVG